MDSRFADVRGIGFDLDQTLYPDSPEVRKAVREEFYKVIAEAQHVSFEQARAMFESAYAEDKATGKVFARYNLPRELVRDCLDRAAVDTILKRDDRLAGLLCRLRNAYDLCLITDSRKQNAHKKLAALGIDPQVFQFGIYWDTSSAHKDTGEAFTEAEIEFNYNPAQLVYVGNSEGDDVKPAAERGWKTIHLSAKPSSLATAGIAQIYNLEGLLL